MTLLLVLVILGCCVTEALRRPGEARCELDQLARGRRAALGGGRIETGLQDVLDALHVLEAEGQSTAACGVHTSVAVARAEADQLLGLAQPGPGAVPREQPRHETADMDARSPALRDHPLRVAHRIGGAFRRIVVVVGRSLTRFHHGVCLDELVPGEDAHQPRVAANRHRLADVAGGDGVERPGELDVMIGMDLALAPLRRVEGGALEWPEGGLLRLEEDLEGTPSRRAVEALAGHVLAPATRLALTVLDVDPRFSAEEALTHVLNGPLHRPLAGRMAGQGGVDREATMVGVLGEGALEDRVVTAGPGDRRLHVVDDEASRYATEGFPRGFEAGEDVGELLRLADVDVLVAAVAQRDDQGVVDAIPAGLAVVDPAEPAEVDFGDLTGSTVGHPHGDVRARPVAAVAPRIAMKRGVRDIDPVATQELLDLGQLQATRAVLGDEPGLDALPVRREPRLRAAGWTGLRPGAQLLGDLARQRFVRRRAVGPPAERLGGPHVAIDRGASVPRGPGHGSAPFAPRNPSQYLENFPHRDLPIGHLTLLPEGQDGLLRVIAGVASRS